MILLPYYTNNGEPSISDADVKKLYNKMVKDGTAGTVFSDGTIKTADDFLDSMKTTCRLYVVVDKTPIAVVWLNRFEGKTARFHFCAFQEIWGNRAIEAGKFVYREILDFKYQSEYVYDALVGYLPKNNEHAVKYMEKLGVQVIGELPFGHWNDVTQTSETCLIVYVNRECI